MLIELRLENHRSVRDEQALTLVAGRGGDANDPRPRRVAGFNEPLLPAAGIYGANASGKSNVLHGLEFLSRAVAASMLAWDPLGRVPREAFAWGDPATPSLFEVTFVTEGVRFEYGFTTDGAIFAEEWLHAWPIGHKQVWYHREGRDIRFGGKLRGENRAIADLTRPNALFLSAAGQLGYEPLAPVYRWIRGIEFARGALPDVRLIRSASARVGLRPSGPYGETEALDTPEWRERRRQAFLRLLRAADVGILDARAVEDTAPSTPPFGPGLDRVYLRHQGAPDAWLPLEAESHGTQTLFDLAAPLLEVLDTGGVLVIDELERGLHPLLALQLLQQFQDPRLNPKNAQLLFTTHDTTLLGTLLGEPPLRRDQVWLTEKDDQGATRLYPLTDYQPRKLENVERGYLQGRYGGVPFLDALVRARGDE